MNFCPQCATPLHSSLRGGRQRPTCPACAWVGFSPAPVGVAAVVQDEHGRVLLVRRNTSFRAGMWCLPCGYLESDEELRAGLARELREETGLETEVGAVVAVHSNLDRDPPFPVGIWLRARPVGGSLQASDDADAVEFFALDALPAELAFETDRRVLEQLLAERDRPDASVRQLASEMHAFVRSKGWYDPASKRPQTPRNLATSLALETAEVLEHFQWRDDIQDRAELAGELADVLLYLLQLADVSGVNLVAAVRDKLQRNAGRVWDGEQA
jgi:ADP-ribose pyrophosphatase YjhB (NUDIX family)/NTP pyrophosphatase (non-canonical NTP hydrolase)